jgi:thiamine biosynthesis lipoprotein
MSRSRGNAFHRVLPNHFGPSEGVSRRRFLLSLGALAGGAALVPLAARIPALATLGGRLQRVETSRPGLGTWIRIVARHPDPAAAERAIAGAFAAIDRVDAQMSIHRADSELARVNAAAGDRALRVSDALLDVVERSRRDAIETGGVLDPTVLPLMRLYGFYDSGRTHLPSDREIAAALACMGPDVVRIDREAGTLGLARRGASLDLGSIGKGWAIDRAVDALRAEGVEDGLVDVGRNVYGLGTPEDDAEGWRVGVLHPVTGAVDRVFTLRDAAIATSGNYEQWRTLDGVRVGHLLDAHLGRPANGHLSATVLARTGLESDGNSSRAFLAGARSVQGAEGVLAMHFIG